MNHTEVLISGTAGYELTAATWLPVGNKILFVTTPVRTYQPNRDGDMNEKCVVIGFLNVSTCALGSIVTKPCRLPRVSKIAVWKNGILLCSAAGLAYLDFETGITQILVASDQIDNQTVCDVTVHQCESLWFVCKSQITQVHTLFRFEQTGTITRIETPSGIDDPANIHFAPNRIDLLANCGRTGAIYKFRAESSLLSNVLRLTFLHLPKTSSLRVDEAGYLHIVSVCEILRFHQSGEFLERFKTQRPIIDFVIASSSRFYVLHENGWFLLERKSASRGRKFLIGPRI